MAKNYKNQSYFESRPDVVRVWNDLEEYHDFCRFELRNFNPADLYRKESADYRAYLASKSPRKPYLGKNPRNNYQPRQHG